MPQLAQRPVVRPTPEPPGFALLYAEQAPRLRRYVRRWLAAADADDVAQETMARALASWDRLDHDHDVWPWLSVVARNLAFDHLRGTRPSAQLDEHLSADAREWESAPEQAAVRSDCAGLLGQVFATLPPRQRQVLRLRCLDGLGIDAIAGLLGTSQTNVRQQLFKARRNMLTRYQERGGILPAVGPFGVVASIGGWIRRRLRDLPSAAAPAASLGAAAAVAVAVVLLPAVGGPAVLVPASVPAAASGPATSPDVPLARPAVAVAPPVAVPASSLAPVQSASPRPAPSAGGQALPLRPSVQAKMGNSPLTPGEQLAAGVEIAGPGFTVSATTSGSNEGNGPLCQALRAAGQELCR